jgi:hypothetical protein
MRGWRGVAPRDFQAFIDPSRVQSRGASVGRESGRVEGGEEEEEEEDLILASRVRTGGISRSRVSKGYACLWGGVAAKRNRADDVYVARVSARARACAGIIFRSAPMPGPAIIPR